MSYQVFYEEDFEKSEFANTKEKDENSNIVNYFVLFFFR